MLLRVLMCWSPPVAQSGLGLANILAQVVMLSEKDIRGVLSVEIMELVLSFLLPTELCTFLCTCKRWNGPIGEPSFREACIRSWSNQLYFVYDVRF